MLSVYSIFQSVDGEVNNRGIGQIVTFIRLAGCTATCRYCDTEYAKSKDSGKLMSAVDVVKEVRNLVSKNVTITGGEPLEQKEGLMELIALLSADNYNISIETNGLNSFDTRMSPFYSAYWVVDIKKEGPMFLSRYIEMNLREDDIIKQVVGTEEDFLSAMGRKITLQSQGVRVRFAYSPEYGKISPNELLQLMKKYGEVDSILNVQLHKVLNLTEAN